MEKTQHTETSKELTLDELESVSGGLPKTADHCFFYYSGTIRTEGGKTLLKCSNSCFKQLSEGWSYCLCHGTSKCVGKFHIENNACNVAFVDKV